MIALLLSLLPALRAWDPRPSAPCSLDGLEFLRGGPTRLPFAGRGRAPEPRTLSSPTSPCTSSTPSIDPERRRNTATDGIARNQRRLAAASSPAQPSASAPSPPAAALPSSVLVFGLSVKPAGSRATAEQLAAAAELAAAANRFDAEPVPAAGRLLAHGDHRRCVRAAGAPSVPPASSPLPYSLP